MLQNRTRRSSEARKGAALVEFALCLPVFVLISMGTIETCRMLYLRQSVKIAAYECARLAILPQVNLDAIQDQCDLILQGRDIKGFSMTINPADPTTVPFGQLITVTVQAPAAENTLAGTWIHGSSDPISESVSIMAEL